LGHQQRNINPEKILIVIPARYQSERLPGKPLAQIAGKSLIHRVCEQLEKVPFTKVVATDNQLIKDEVEKYGYQVILTSADHQNGTSRCIACYEQLKEQGQSFDILINVQGDEPLINPEQIEELASLLTSYPALNIGTLIKSIHSLEDYNNPNIVKVTKGIHSLGYNKALYFSRSPIPYNRNDEKGLSHNQAFKHVGIYGFRTSILSILKGLPTGILENIEKLEQLKWLENGHDIGLVETTFENIGVDTAEDITTVENFLKNNGLS
jgi:3-deoxy-manno-octulosonate cytidylyltransferase (CMP-KDO synthetase)